MKGNGRMRPHYATAQLLTLYMMIQNFDQPYGIVKTMLFAVTALGLCVWNDARLSAQDTREE